MTTEQKAKAYDEALKLAKDSYNYPSYPGFIRADVVFPELKESEDERIRKEIIDFLWKEKIFLQEAHSSVENNPKYRFVMDAIAWIEKQGEQKPIDKIQLGKKYKCIASPRYSTFRRGNIYKPVDNFLCNLMNLCYECFEPIEDSEQKPTDEDMKEALRTEYEKGRADAFAQMQKEWSEEDEQYLLVCKNALAKYQTTDKWDADIISCWLENKLKVPQNTWKPSDEQMRALENFIGTIPPYEPMFKVLKSLYNELKKLKVE